MAILGSKQKTVASYETEAAKVVTLIGSSAVCEGDFLSKDSARVDGTINGNVTIEGTLIVGASGRVKGNVKAENVFLAGKIKGSIDASRGKIEISDTGKVTGDIAASSLVIDENAVFNGRCIMNDGAGQEKAENKAKTEKAASGEAASKNQNS